MSLKLNGLIFIIGVTCGIYFGYKLSNRESTVITKEIIKEQTSVCKATITKHINKDGSVDEVQEFLAQHNEKREVEVSKPIKRNGVGLFKDEFLYKRKVYEDIKIFGFNLDIGAIAKTSKDKVDFGVIIEW